MANLPSDIAQQAIDASGVDYLLGDIDDGSRPAQVLLRAYEQCLMQLLRGANWNFARKTTQLTLLAGRDRQHAECGNDCSCTFGFMNTRFRLIARKSDLSLGICRGKTLAFRQATSRTALPCKDCHNRRRVHRPWEVLGKVPRSSPASVSGQRGLWCATHPCNYPSPTGVSDTIGVAPTARTVILTNVQFAFCVYTADNSLSVTMGLHCSVRHWLRIWPARSRYHLPRTRSSA